jgi:tetratricopeptide (TPR) repeat protein
LTERGGARGAGPVADQVVELVVVHEAGRRRGSGYRVSARAILTAAHVVEGATSVEVRGETWAADGTSWWADSGTDLAVVSIDPAGMPDCVPVEFARVGEHVTSFEIEAVGFPRWKARNEDGTVPVRGDGARRFHDSHHALGVVAALSNRRGGTWEVTFAGTPEAAAAGSPWSGMSGAALWANGRVVGVVSEHHPAEGAARLAASRIDRALDRLGPAGSGELRALLLALPEQSVLLPDVASRETGALRAHRAYLRQFAPAELLGRAAEIEALTAFCAADEPYLYWTARPWAGKTALLAWFALHPPPAVDVVSFFVNSRYGGQSDSDAFTESVSAQLEALVGEPELPLAAVTSLRAGELLDLLEIAARRCEQANRRLLLIVDGLDEDTGTAKPAIVSLLPRYPPPGLRIVLAGRPFPTQHDGLAPDHPLTALEPVALVPSAVAVGIEKAARAELGHLMRGSPLQRDIVGLVTASGGGLTTSDLQELTGSSVFELEDVAGTGLGRTIVSLLSPVPLGEAAGHVLVFAHETLLSTAQEAFGPRGLAAHHDRIDAWAETYQARGFPSGTPRYLLRGYPRLLAEGGDVRRIVAFAADSRRHDWMRDATGSDAVALAELSAASELISRSGDVAALVRVSARRARLSQRNLAVPPLLPAAWIAIGDPVRAAGLASLVLDPHRRAECLAAMVQAALRRGEGAESLIAAAVRQVREIDDRRGAVIALVRLAEVLAVGRHREHAEQLLEDLPDLLSRSLMARASWAEPIVMWETDPLWRKYPELLGAAVGAIAATGDLRRVERMAGFIEDPVDRVAALTVLARRLISTHQEHSARDAIAGARRVLPRFGRSGGFSRRFPLNSETSPELRSEVLGSLVVTAGELGDPGLSLDLAEELTEIDPPADRYIEPWVFAGAFAWAGALDRAEAMAANEAGETRARALAEVVAPAIKAGEFDRADRLVAEVLRLLPGATAIPVLARSAGAIASVPDRWDASHVLGLAESCARSSAEPSADAVWPVLVLTAAKIGDHESAERMAAEAVTAPDWPDVLAEAALMAARDGDHDRAVRLAVLAEDRARTLDEHWLHCVMLLDLVDGLLRMGDRERVDRVVTAIESEVAGVADLAARCRVVTSLIDVTIENGDRARADRLALEAHQIALAAADNFRRSEALAGLVAPVARAGDFGWAEQLVADIAASPFAVVGLLDLMTEGHRAGEHELTSRLTGQVREELSGITSQWYLRSFSVWAAELDDDTGYLGTRQFLVRRIVEAGDCETAEQLARDVAEPGFRARFLAQLAWTAADQGDVDVAGRIFTELTALTWPNAEALVELAHAAAALGERDRARDLARSAEWHIRSYATPPLTDDLLVRLAGAALAAGDFDRAEGLAREVRDEPLRLRMLSSVAESAAEDDAHRPTALRLVTEVAATPDWGFAIPALARVHPGSLAQLTDVLVRPPDE